MYPIFKAVQAALSSPPGEACLRGYEFIPGGESLRDDRKEYLVKKKKKGISMSCIEIRDFFVGNWTPFLWSFIVQLSMLSFSKKNDWSKLTQPHQGINSRWRQVPSEPWLYSVASHLPHPGHRRSSSFGTKFIAPIKTREKFFFGLFHAIFIPPFYLTAVLY